MAFWAVFHRRLPRDYSGNIGSNPEKELEVKINVEASLVKELLLPVREKVSLRVDQVTRPGAIVSGKVTFSDGQQTDWFLDQTGHADLQEFHLALQQEVAKLGY